MTRLIDVDALLEAMKKEDVLKVYECIQLVNNALTVQREGWVNASEGLKKVLEYHQSIADAETKFAKQYYSMTGFGYEVDQANNKARKHQQFADVIKSLLAAEPAETK